MQRPDLELDLESSSDVVKVFSSLVRLLRSRSITQYIESHPAAYNEFVAAVQEIAQLALPTPALTTPNADIPNEQAPTPLSSQYTDPNPDGHANSQDNLFVDYHDQSPVDVYNQHSNLFVGPYNRSRPIDEQPLEPAIKSSILQQLHTTQHTSKRQQIFEDDRASKRTHIELAGRDEDGLESSDTQYPRKYLQGRNVILPIQSTTGRHLALKHAQETHQINATITIQRVWRGYKQRKSLNAIHHSVVPIQAAAKGFLQRREIRDIRVRIAAVLIQRVWRLRKIKSWRQYRRRVVILQSLWRGKCARRLLSFDREPSDAAGSEDGERFGLSADLRSKLRRIMSVPELKNAQDFCYSMRYPVDFISFRPDEDALEVCGGSPTVLDRRLKQLRILIDSADKTERSAKTLKMVAQVQKRVHLEELAAKYMEETAVPKKKRQVSVKTRFTDLLFPETVNYKSQMASKGKKSKYVTEENVKQVDDGEIHQEEVEKRTKAKRTLEYWKRLGMPLLRMTQRFGIGILLLLPDDLTEASLHAIRKGQYQDMVDYIDLYHPGLKEQISNLSALLPDIIAKGLSEKYLIIETISSHELLYYPLKKLFERTDNNPSPNLAASIDNGALEHVWAGQTEHCPPEIAIEARNKMIYHTALNSAALP